jgi:lysozyme family protein
MADFDKALRVVLDLEGGYADDPADAGGKTCLGITEGLARARGFQGEMADMTLAEARAIYRAEFWDGQRLGEVQSQAIAEELFECSVLCGKRTAAQIAQMSANDLNRGGLDWPDVAEDGSIGSATIGALNAAARVRERTMVKAMNCLQYAAFHESERRRPANERFMVGWVDRRIHLDGGDNGNRQP